ncbi:hypothetical protein [Saezia sanguinis]|uniref:hypothetical protein n=1 Tax=Saezia sanguinis TaxID=1965230 RepID=UPI0030D93F46
MDNNGQFTGSGNLDVQAAQTLTNQGEILSAGHTAIAADTFNNRATTQAGGNLGITAQMLTNQNAQLIAGGEIRIQAGDPKCKIA